MGYTLHPKIVTLNSKQKPLEYVEKCGKGFADVPYGLESFKPIYKPRSEKKICTLESCFDTTAHHKYV